MAHVRRFVIALVAAAPALTWAGPAAGSAASLPTDFADQLMASSLALPTGLAEVPDPPSVATRRMLFVEQFSGRVGLLAGDSVTTVGTVPTIFYGGERGLLGITVDPGWPERPYIYVHYNDYRISVTRIAISRFTVTGDLAYSGSGALTFDTSTRYDLLLDLPDAASNHNGGTLRFGTDGNLYVSLGDDAVPCAAQDLTLAQGKILRLDVSRLPATGTGPAPYALLAPADNPYAANPDSVAQLVYAEGLRNPFRFSIDPATNALAIGDVGGGVTEELDLVTQGGMDLGAPWFEGNDPSVTCPQPPPETFTPPIAWYVHPLGYAIIGGPRYRVPAGGALSFPSEFDGDIFFLDYYSGLMRRVKLTAGTWLPASSPGQPSVDDWGEGMTDVSDLIETSDGALWYCRQFQSGSGTGEIRRIVYTGSTSVPPPVESLLTLATPRPNPAHDGATIAWTQSRGAHVRLALYAADGHRVRTLIDGEIPSGGSHQQRWDGLDDGGRRARAGVYFARLEVNGASKSVRLVLLR